jgi:assimilatory nitrate reductase catalytic subunit
MILSARGPEQQSHGVDNCLAFINLALALGKAGRRGSGWGCLTGQGNGQGGREHGQKADQLPGYRKLADPADRAAVAKIWGVDPDSLPQPGLSASELLAQLGAGGTIHGLLVMASNPIVSAPDSDRLRQRLATLDLLVVADIFLSDTAALADVVLPITQWAEERGTTTNLEGRVILRAQAKEPRPAAASRTMPGSAMTASPGKTASSGRARPQRIPARRACSWIASPSPMAAPASTRSAMASLRKPPARTIRFT